MVDGAVYFPSGVIEPMAGLIDQVTAVGTTATGAEVVP